MIFERLPEPIDALVIKESFNDKELLSIMNEISSFTDKAQDSNGVWLTDVYKDLEMSATHNAVMQNFFTQQVAETLTQVNSLYGIFGAVNNHATQIRYFGHGQILPLHMDEAAITIMTFVFNEPRNFDGGNITLQIGTDIAYEQDIENNLTVIFPSFYNAGLSEIKVDEKNVFGSGLYVISSYLFVESR
jgi:hypothetical protein